MISRLTILDYRLKITRFGSYQKTVVYSRPSYTCQAMRFRIIAILYMMRWWFYFDQNYYHCEQKLEYILKLFSIHWQYPLRFWYSYHSYFCGMTQGVVNLNDIRLKVFLNIVQGVSQLVRVYKLRQELFQHFFFSLIAFRR